jgi:hypothetical protein
VHFSLLVRPSVGTGIPPGAVVLMLWREPSLDVS